MKRILITATALLAGATEANKGQPQVAHVGSVIDVDDNTAGLLVVSGKARYAADDAKLKDTTKEAEAAADAKAKAAASPDQALASMIAAAVAAAVKPQAGPAA
jgi:hypothetical protein